MGEIKVNKAVISKAVLDLAALKTKVDNKSVNIEFLDCKGGMVDEVLEAQQELNNVSDALVVLINKTYLLMNKMQSEFTDTDQQLTKWFNEKKYNTK